MYNSPIDTMNKKIFYLLIVFSALTASIFLLKKIFKKDGPKIYLQELQIKDMDGNLMNLTVFYGKPLIINYWATWCGPCREEFPYFENNYKKYGDRINFLMISAEVFESIKAFRTANKYTLPFAQSQKQLNESGITEIPVTAIYSAQGNLLSTKTSPLNEAELHKIIIDLIK